MNFLKSGFLAMTLLSLSACGFTPQGTLIKDTIRVKGAQAEDAGLANSLWFICNAASIGAIQRRFGKSVETATIYRQMCNGSKDANVVEPVEPVK